MSNCDLSYTSGLEGALKTAEMPQNSNMLSTAPYQQSAAWGKCPELPLQWELVQKQFRCLVTSLPSAPLCPEAGRAGRPLSAGFLPLKCSNLLIFMSDELALANPPSLSHFLPHRSPELYTPAQPSASSPGVFSAQDIGQGLFLSLDLAPQPAEPAALTPEGLPLFLPLTHNVRTKAGSWASSFHLQPGFRLLDAFTPRWWFHFRPEAATVKKLLLWYLYPGDRQDGKYLLAKPIWILPQHRQPPSPPPSQPHGSSLPSPKSSFFCAHFTHAGKHLQRSPEEQGGGTPGSSGRCWGDPRAPSLGCWHPRSLPPTAKHCSPS